MPLPKPLKGIVPPLLTPLSTPESLDVESLERLLEHVIAGGVHGVFILGTTGEGPALGLGLAKEFIARTAALLRGRVPLLVGVTHASTADSLALVRAAADAGRRCGGDGRALLFSRGAAGVSGMGEAVRRCLTACRFSSTTCLAMRMFALRSRARSNWRASRISPG